MRALFLWYWCPKLSYRDRYFPMQAPSLLWYRNSCFVFWVGVAGFLVTEIQHRRKTTWDAIVQCWFKNKEKIVLSDCRLQWSLRQSIGRTGSRHGFLMDVLQNNRTPNKNGFLQLNPLAGPRCGDAGEANFGFAASFPLLRMLQSGARHHDLDKSKSWSCLTLLRSFTKNVNFFKSCFEDTKKFKARFPSLSRNSQRGTREWWRRCQTEREIETLNVTDKLSGWQILWCLWCGLLG